jgi:carbonic anhydrase
MTLLEEILQYNQQFVETEEYKKYETTKFPNKKLVILTCMDTRLVELLPKAMNIKQGDTKIIKNAGAVVTHPFGSIMRSILVAIYELQANEVLVVGHHDCGMSKINPDHMMSQFKERGISPKIIETLKFSGIDFNQWLKGFDRVEESVKHSVEMIRNHPLLPEGIPVHGMVIHPTTGKLDLVVNGYPA